MINTNDISVILPIKQELQQHRISPIFNNQSNIVIEEQIHVHPSSFLNVYYTKRSMKQLLEERSQVCQFLKINLKSEKKHQCQIEQQYNIIRQIFQDCPTNFDPINLLLISNFGVTYGFFSTDGKYVPMCKKCNVSTYVFIKGKNIKIICCNQKCKTKILGEVVIELKNQQKNKQTFLKQKVNVKTPQLKQPQVKVRTLSKEEEMLIKKTAKKIIQF